MTGGLGYQGLTMFRDYRCYITPEYYLITYQDADLIRVFRTGHQHRPGFLRLLVELLWYALNGTRTELRDKWALWNQDYDVEAEMLDLKCRAADRQVLEFWFEKGKYKMKEQEHDV